MADAPVPPQHAAPTRSSGGPGAFTDIARGRLVSRFRAGAGFAASAIPFVLARPALLVKTLVPMAIQSALFVAFVAVTLTRLDELVLRYGPAPGTWYSFLGSLLWFGLAAAAVLLGVVGALLLGSVVCDPFYDAISEAVEADALGRSVGEPFSVGRAAAGIVRELGVTVMRLALYLAVAIPLWVIGLTGVGSVVAAPLALVWTWAFVALEGLSRSQARHALGARARWSVLRREAAVAVGFGALGWLLAFIPFTTPLLVVGGTRLFLALAAWDRVDNSLSEADKARLRA